MIKTRFSSENQPSMKIYDLLYNRNRVSTIERKDKTF